MRPRDSRRCSRSTTSGAATTWLRVNIAPAEAPSGTKARARSGLPLALIPAVHEENKNPWGRLFNVDEVMNPYNEFDLITDLLRPDLPTASQSANLVSPD